MFNNAKRHVFIALLLIGLMAFGAVAAEARDRDTGGSDRLVKGAAIGAAVGAVTQMVRGRTEGRELLKGAAVGGAVGAAAGAYSDYKQEKNAREDDRRYRDRYYEGRSYRGSRRGDYYPRNNRARRAHRHTDYCSHR